jgi:hypothetical protein
MGYIYMNIDARGNGGHTSTRNDYTLDSDVSSEKYMQSLESEDISNDSIIISPRAWSRCTWHMWL